MNPVFQSNGKMIQFDSVGDGIGVLAAVDTTVIFELNSLVAARRGGILKITKEQYDQLVANKKKDPTSTRSNRRYPTIRLDLPLSKLLPEKKQENRPATQSAGGAVDAAAGKPSAPSAEPPLVPRRGRPRKVQTNDIR